MKNRLMTIQQDNVQTFYIDQEVLECAQLNMRTKSRVAEAEKAEAEAKRKRKVAKAKKNRFEAYTNKTVCSSLLSLAGIFAVARAGFADLIHPAIWIPVAIIGLCAVSAKVGMWFGKAGKK